MGDIEGRIKQARRELLLSAARRWEERSSIRNEGLNKISLHGVGAADTPKIQLEWTKRQLAKAGPGLTLAERIIGTNDFIRFAPSVRASSVAEPVARIVTLPGGGHIPEGVATGFLVAGPLLLTNYHVFPARDDARGYGANFGHVEDERGVNDGCYFELDPDRFFLSDKDFDFALVGVKANGLNGEPLERCGQVRLIESTGKILTGQAVNIIQHPNGGPRRYAVTNNKLLDVLPEGFLHYETDTEPGSSGSPVFNGEWELVGLHHSGVPLIQDGQIMTRLGTVWDPQHGLDSDIMWVANECARVSAIVNRLRQLQAASPTEQAQLDRLLVATSDPADAALANPLESTALLRGAAATAGNVFQFTGPVTIQLAPAAGTLAIPPSRSLAPTASAPVPADTLQIEEKALVFDPAYAERGGYDAQFLGVTIPLPGIDPSKREEMYSVTDYKTYFEDYRNVPKLKLDKIAEHEALILHYHHYSLAFNKKYRMCLWTASNCDYRSITRQDTRRRAELGGENWRYDPRVPQALQLADNDVYKPARRIDRGHIVRREDNAWGLAGLDTEYANSDTYHWTNCTPQHEAFNQENPRDASGGNIYSGLGTKGIWGQFEDSLALALKAGDGQAVIFAGPILDDHFKNFDWGSGEISVPKTFWKVFVIPASAARRPKLQVYGYIFDQAPAVRKFGMTYEGVELPQFTRNRALLSAISARTGVVFPDVVIEAEQPL